MTVAGLPPLVIVFLPLIGAVVGAALAGGVRYVLDRRSEAIEFRAAVRVLIDDFTQVRDVLDRAAGGHDVLGVARSPLELDPSLVSLLEVGAWTTERRVLSRGLVKDTLAWDAVRWAVRSTATLRRLYALKSTASPDPRTLTRVDVAHDDTLGRIDAALGSLARFA